MSHQGYEGWFPECIACRLGNVGAVVCLDPSCHEAHEYKPIELKSSVYIHGDLSIDEKLIFENEHWWKCCQLCDRRILADAGAWGTFALCIACYNEFVNRGVIPPTNFSEIKKEKS